MLFKYSYFILGLVIPIAWSCNSNQSKKAENTTPADTVTTITRDTVQLPEPYATKSTANFSNVKEWPQDKTPVAPAGFTVSRFADTLKNPRWIYIGPNGDIFVAESSTEKGGIKSAVKNAISGKSKSQNSEASANRITIFRDTDHNGIPEVRNVFLTGLNQPLGMLILNNSFYVANTDGLMQFPYKEGQTSITGKGKKILELPAGGYNNHWTRNLLAGKDGKKIYITVGSGSNVAEHGIANEVRRANILEINPDGTGEKIYASGIRNPVGLEYAPGTNVLWTSVNERDELGDELVPDYLTGVKEGGFYGWPYAYFGSHEDPRLKGQAPDLVKKTIVPDVSLGAHTASLGLAFDEKKNFPGKYAGGAFIGQHGSWNRSQLSGYKVVFVPFKNGKPTGPMEDFLTGFITGQDKDVFGRPAGVAFTQDGSLLVADDAGNTIWRVAAKK